VVSFSQVFPPKSCTLSSPPHAHVGPCHHGMARPQVSDGGTASNMEGSRKLRILNKQVQQEVVFRLGTGRGANSSSPCKRIFVTKYS
jgi:hypothetical protein